MHSRWQVPLPTTTLRTMSTEVCWVVLPKNIHGRAARLSIFFGFTMRSSATWLRWLRWSRTDCSMVAVQLEAEVSCSRADPVFRRAARTLSTIDEAAGNACKNIHNIIIIVELVRHCLLSEAVTESLRYHAACRTTLITSEHECLKISPKTAKYCDESRIYSM